MNLVQFAAGAIFAALVGGAAYRARALSRSGALAAWIVGTMTFGIAGWSGTLVLFAFFLPSTVLSRIGKLRKKTLVDVGKQGARDAWQVIANGGIAALALACIQLDRTAALAAFAGAFAAASADTWGTEIGTLARGTPRSLFTLRPIATGLSGGVTWQGTLAEFAGAALVAAAASATGIGSFVAIALGGITGAFLDSALGATAQALRYCPACDRTCETNPHVCGTATTLRRGFAWFENDAVNLAATVTGALVATAVSVRR